MIYELLKQKNAAQNITADGGLGSIPRYDDRAAWENLPEDVKTFFKTAADGQKGREYPILPATFYMDYVRIGDRTKYQTLYFQRRADLMALTVAECIGAAGEYVDGIIDLVWAICEETSWVIPAHNYRCEPSVPQIAGELPDVEHGTNIDLFSAETGAAISMVYHLLGDMIGESAPTAKRRMEIEVKKRIIEPYLNHDFFWMGFDGPVNNWNPWINSNALVAFAVFEKDTGRLGRALERSAASVDNFIKCYKPDGACDEGPSYFGVAGASMFDYLETLADMTKMTKTEMGVYGDELIKNMARYIYRVYIGKDYFVNFADGPVRWDAPAKLMARVGEAIGDDNLVAFGDGFFAGSQKENPGGNYKISNNVYRGIKSLFQRAYPGKIFTPPKAHWFGDTQILTARDAAGMFVAAKGGHNGEGHNHNDVGHFILYSDSDPVVVDAGVEAYTKKTFSANRYEIWTMQSGYHNLPTVNGFDQEPGAHRSAAEVRYAHEGDTTTLSMQLKNAYHEGAGIESYTRQFVFEHGRFFSVCDSYRLKHRAAPLVFNLMCANRPKIEGNTVYLGKNIEMAFDASGFAASVEEIELTDDHIRSTWRQDYLYRLRLTEKEMHTENEITVRFAKNSLERGML